MRFEYEISRHSAEAFTDLVYSCNQGGECTLEQVPLDQVTFLQDILNSRGSLGWELVQVIFGKDGVLIFWRRMITP